MRLCEQCHMAQFNGKWHSSNQRNLFLLGVCFNNLKYKIKAISTNSATWHCSKTQVLCRFEPNSAIFLSSALGQLWGWPSQSPNGDSVSAAASVGRWATSHRDVAAPKGEPSLASPFGGRWCPVGTVQRLTEPAGESGLALARTERASCQPHRPLPWLSLSGRRFLGVHPSGKGGAMPLFPWFLFRLTPIKFKGKVEAFLKKSFTKKLYARFAWPRRPWCNPPLTSSCWPASCAAPWRGYPCACGCSWASLPPARPRR